MTYSKRDVLIGLIFIILIVVASLVYKKVKTPKPLEDDSVNNISFLEEIKNDFRYDIPDDIKVAELKDVAGGDGRGIVTETEILADLIDPEVGFYQVWVEKDGEYVSLGKMRVAKGGWMIEYEKINSQFPVKFIVSLEKTFDNKIETKILEGTL